MTPILADRVSDAQRRGNISPEDVYRARAAIAAEFWHAATTWEKQAVISRIPRDAKGARQVELTVAELPFDKVAREDRIKIALAAADLLERIARIGYIWP